MGEEAWPAIARRAECLTGCGVCQAAAPAFTEGQVYQIVACMQTDFVTRFTAKIVIAVAGRGDAVKSKKGSGLVTGALLIVPIVRFGLDLAAGAADSPCATGDDYQAGGDQQPREHAGSAG